MPTTSFDFSGRVAIVTGAAGGIGEAYARALAAAGASVAVADLDLDRAQAVAASITDGGGTAAAVSVDVSDPASADAMAAFVDETFGGIDHLVNNAAIFGGMKIDSLLRVDWDYLTRFMSVNLMGALVCTRACYRSMRRRGGGSIVNQSSTAAYLYSNFYGLAKAGVNSLTQQLAHEVGSLGIRVNAIAPGPIATAAADTVAPPEFIAEMVASFPIKRQGTPDDLVGMCLFLLSDEAAWISGQIFNVDGGQVMRP